MEGKKRYIAIVLFLLIGLTLFAFANPAEEEKSKKKNGNGDETQEVSKDESNEKTLEAASDNEPQVQNQIANQPADTSYADALAAVEKAEKLLADKLANVDFDDLSDLLDDARDLIEKVTDDTSKEGLTDRADEVEESLDAIALVAALEEKVEEAENKEDIADAIDFRDVEEINEVVAALKNESVKAALEEILDDLNKVLDDEAAPSYDGVEDGETTNEDVTITIEDETDVEVKVTLDGIEKEYKEDEPFTEEGVYEIVLIDEAYNETAITFTIDKTKPAIKSNWWKKTVEADKTAEFTNFPEFTITDATEVTTELIKGEVKMGTPGVYRLRYRFTDAAGNSIDKEVQVTVVDTTKPSVRSNWWKKTVEANKDAEFTDFPEFTVTDNAEGEITTEFIKGEVKMGVPGVYRLRYRFTDASGNSIDKEVQVTVVDTTKPSVRSNWWKKTVEANKDAEFTDFPEFTVTDNAEGEITTEFIKGEVKMGVPGVYRLRYRFTDASGNSIDKEVEVTVVDTTKPSVRSNWWKKTVEANKDAEFTDFPEFTVTDNAEGEITTELIKGEVKMGAPGVYRLRYRFTDASGNSIDKEVEVTVVDTTAPLLTLNGESNITLEAGIDTYEELGATVTDNVDETNLNLPPKYINYRDKDGNFKGKVDKVDTKKLGEYKVVYQYTDSSNNEAVDAARANNNYVMRIVNVVDTTAPLLTLNGESNITLEAGIDAYEELGATVTDNVDETNLNLPPKYINYRDKDGNFKGKVDKVDTTQVGEYKVVYQYTDSSNNEAVDAARADHNYVMRIVNVVDTIDPTLTIKENSIGNDPYYSEVSFALSDSNKIDYFEVNGIKFDRTDAKYSDANYQNIKSALVEGENTITLYDTAGNSTSKTFIIDWTNPVITVSSKVGKEPHYSEMSFKLYDNNMIDYFEVNGTKFDRSNAKWSDANFQNIKSAVRNGENTIVLYDVAGNKSELVFTLDLIAPEISLRDGTIGNDPYFSKVNFGFYDNNLADKYNINGTEFDFTDSKWSNANYDNFARYLVEGENTITLYDTAGNKVEKKFIMDWTAGDITVSSTVGQAPYFSQISFKLYDSNMIDYFEVNGTKFDRSNAKWSDANFQNIKSAVKNGANTIVLYDIAGNKSELAFTLDLVAPTINISTGTIGENPYSKLNLKMYDANEVASVVINGKQLPQKGKYVDINDGSAYTFLNGENIVTVTDKAGNVTTKTFIVER